MSVKKTGVVHTITAEQKEKMDKQADIQSRMEAGKVEIMKVVEGVQGADKLSELIERGKKKGNLSSSELLDVLEDMDLSAEQWVRTIFPTCRTTWSPPWSPWRRSPRRKSWTPTPWWIPSAQMTRCACI